MPKPLSHHQRYLIKEMVDVGHTKREISETLGIPMSTARKWMRRSKKGILDSQLGRPRKESLSTFSSQVITRIKELGGQKPGWGGISIYVELVKLKEFADHELPSPSSINRYLEENGLVRKYEKRTEHSSTAVIKSTRPHHVWQLDAEGNECIDGVGAVAPIHLKDTFTTICIHSYPCPLRTMNNHAATEDYQRVMRMAWCEWGLNRILQTDHESIFYGNSKASPFPSRFHLWLIGLGTQLVFTPKGKPYKQGSVERSHWTMFLRAIFGQIYGTWVTLYEEMTSNRNDLNHLYPCRTLGGMPPLKKFPQAIHSGKPYSVDKEQELFELKRVHSYLAKKDHKWFRKIGSAKTISLGNQVYYLKNAKQGQEARIIFNNRKKTNLLQ